MYTFNLLLSLIESSSVSTTDSTSIGTMAGPQGSSSQLVIILVVVCAVLGLLFIGGIVVFIVLLCRMRGKNTQVTKEEAGM